MEAIDYIQLASFLALAIGALSAEIGSRLDKKWLRTCGAALMLMVLTFQAGIWMLSCSL